MSERKKRVCTYMYILTTYCCSQIHVHVFIMQLKTVFIITLHIRMYTCMYAHTHACTPVIAISMSTNGHLKVNLVVCIVRLHLTKVPLYT